MSLNNIRNEGESVYYFSFLYYFVINSREGNGNPLQESCLGNPMGRGTWQATAHGVVRVRHNLSTKPPIHEILTIALKPEKEALEKVVTSVSRV